MQIHETSKIQTLVITDGVLAQQTLAGDPYAFEDLVKRYSTPLFNFIYRFLGDYDQACDILQHVFIQLHTSLSTLRTDKPLKAWLFQVARNRCLDELRRKRVIHFSELESVNEDEELSLLAAIPDNGPLPEELAEQSDLQQRLQEAIQTLPIKFRSVVLLRYAGQLSFSEIGQTLSMPEATAKTYFQRAKPLLRTALMNQVQLIAH
ncbi:MAG TPA: RNA polymerase subunit sigma-24 [Ktedonobacter sp.]|jgi:RNA polymerase sigma-70 factor (ECF subfamily)|nr:RNA polymerase subunit sigma-24 [Ktedonobacter sp.]HAT46338.1 RNA polymerase subunit sigma-24 [Ktedonobacter sp.]HBE27244.1 RNA polymerase subunit sigma-24 [Ktedonobacter sp.]HCF85865.1 RNA polymerase subunit sigma-24 [Ktedonobacter sp.]